MPYLLRSIFDYSTTRFDYFFWSSFDWFLLDYKVYMLYIHTDCEIVCKNTLIKWRRAHIIIMPTKVEPKQRHNENQKR